MSSSVPPFAPPTFWPRAIRLNSASSVFLASGALVSLPVFAQAPLVRNAPWVSLVLTLAWLGISLHMMSLRSARIWGSLCYGFTLTWLAGSLYWGWLRTEPLWHIPVEALALPIAVYGLWRGFARVGSYFFMGSLFGTAITDLYIHTVRLLPEWRTAMQPQASDVVLAGAMQNAMDKMQAPIGLWAALVLGFVLLVVGVVGLKLGRDRQGFNHLHWWAFSGAVLCTLVVDGLFGLGAWVQSGMT
ncbi:MAG: DUF3120 domain-containing protein [Cyanobacteria bacterium P01_E01_bin.34]